MKMLAFRSAILFLFVFVLCPPTFCPRADNARHFGSEYSDKSSVSSVAFGPDGKVLAIGRYRSVELRDVASGRKMGALTGIEGAVTSLAFGAKGRLLALATGTPGKDGVIELWDWRAGRRVRTLSGHSDLVYAIALRSDGEQLAAASYDRLVSLWSIDPAGKADLTSLRPRYLRDHIDSVYGLAYGRSGTMLATAAGDRTVKVWDTLLGKRLFTLNESTAELYSVAFRPDGKQIAAGGADKTLRVWNLVGAAGTLVHSAFAHEGAILKVLYSHDGKEIYTSGEDNIVKQWDAETLDEKGFFPRQADWPQCIAVSPDDKLLAVGCHGGSCRLYSTADRKFVTSGRSHAPGGGQRPRPVQAYRSKQHVSLRAPIPAEGNTLSALDMSPCSAGFVERSSSGAAGAMGEVEVKSQGGNERISTAMPVPIPCAIDGTLWNGKLETPAPSHFYRFPARRGEALVLEVMARRKGSPLDSEIEVLDAQGRPVERAVLRAVSQTEITLSDRDSASPGIRLLLRPEFQINDYVLLGRELTRIYALPKGPDDDYLFRNFRGQRTGFLGTTPEFHTVGAHVYRVEVHPPGRVFSPNGMPLTHLFYKNDDGGPLYGRDSYLEFSPPVDGEYIVRLSDVRDQQGEKFTYQLRLHPPRPDFNISLSTASVGVPKNGAVPITVECERYDGFQGEIAVRLEGLPSGFSATEATIEAGETNTTLLMGVAPGTETPKPEMGASYRVVATALVGSKQVERTIEPDNKNRRLSVGSASNVQVVTDLRDVTLHPGEEADVEARITRLNGIKNRIPLDIRNLPFGVRVVNVGLNGVLINEQETTRKFTLHCDSWVRPQSRSFYVTANVEGGIANTAAPLTLHILQPNPPQR